MLHAALSAHGLRTPAAQRKGAAGRKPWDEVVILKALVVQALYNLSDGQMEFQRRDRLSFMRFLGPGIEDRVPDATTLWLYREALAKAGMVERLCDAFDALLRAQGCLAMGGQIIDASIVAAPKQRNGREETAQIKAGETPPSFAADPAMDRPKDKDARWTKKHGRSHHGHKNHVSIDRRHKLVRRHTVTDAARHDSQEPEALLDPDNTAAGVWADSACRRRVGGQRLPQACGRTAPAAGVWADSACRSAATEKSLAERGCTSRIHRRPARNRPAAHRARAAGQHHPLARARPGRARVRRPSARHGRQTGPHHRPDPRQGEDRDADPGP
jgi:transposase, IS5 family